ncbi:hypothetical protein GCM10011495_37380 [Hymenobacter frigidus]|uniref:Uncharacterized protein n=1 Tax=Hymenobacter frigidus TaxID=1524095 RepID=A0ABQ2AFM7_9BACT|nr:hypothetical protein GCM10011495_37380 [Hymenobacter frigidus]
MVADSFIASRRSDKGETMGGAAVCGIMRDGNGKAKVIQLSSGVPGAILSAAKDLTPFGRLELLQAGQR